MRRALGRISRIASVALWLAAACAQERTRPSTEGSVPTASATTTSTTTATASTTPTTTATSTTQRPAIVALPPNDKVAATLALRFRAGAVDDPPGKAGITYLAARLLAEGGTEALDVKQLLNALFPMATTIAARVDKEQTTFFTTVHRDHLTRILPILTDVLLHPRWDEREFARLREEAVNDIEKRLRQGDDENLGKEALEEVLFRGHPYGRLTLGHVRDLRSLSLSDLRAHARKVFSKDRLTVGASGGYPAELPERLADALAALPDGAPAAEVPKQAPSRKPRFLLVEKQADSTAISLGIPFGLRRSDGDWAPLSVARSILGEHRHQSGRLFQRLREARGLNYGDYAYIEHFEQAGFDAATAQTGRARRQQEFTVWLRPVQNQVRLFALRAALYELSRTLDADPFSPDEVERTKEFLDGYILLFDQTDARKLGYALDDEFYGMRGFLAGWRAVLKGVTAEKVNAAWRRWIDPAKLQIVLAGPGMADAKKAILEGAATPIRYPPGAQKPPPQLEEDEAIARFTFGVQGEDDVEIVPVERLF